MTEDTFVKEQLRTMTLAELHDVLDNHRRQVKQSNKIIGMALEEIEGRDPVDFEDFDVFGGRDS